MAKKKRKKKTNVRTPGRVLMAQHKHFHKVSQHNDGLSSPGSSTTGPQNVSYRQG